MAWKPTIGWAMGLMLAAGTALAGGISPAVLTSHGSVLVKDGTLIPPYPAAGRWAGGESGSAGSRETRGFIFLASPKPPAIELVVALDKEGAPSDGTFEVDLVKRHLSQFAARAGLAMGGVFFDTRPLGPAFPRHAMVKLYGTAVTAWAHIYIFPARNPSLTFIAFRPTEDAAEIEGYLSSIGIGAR